MSEKIKLAILDANAVNPGDLSWDAFKEFADITIYERTSQDELLDRIRTSDAIFVNKVVITEEILQQLPLLKYIGVCATGYNVIDTKACSKRGIVVTNVPAYSTDAVAQHVFALITNFSNHVALHSQSVHNGDWIKAPDFVYWKQPLMELSGKTLGIFGYGNIGKKVAEIGRAFGMKVICCTRTPKPGMPESVSFEDLLKQSDFVSLHAPLTDKTKNIINKNSLSLMKPTAFLINTARGGLINEQELAEALKDNVIAGYAADVISIEPMRENNPLLKCPNSILTPHIAWAPKETRSRLMGVCLENLKAWINGSPQNQVQNL